MIDNNYFWTNVFGLALSTFLIRYSIIFFSGKIIFSDRVKEIFAFIPVAILPAFIAPVVFYNEGNVDIILGKERFVIIILAFFISFRFKSILLTILSGLFLLYTCQFL